MLRQSDPAKDQGFAETVRLHRSAMLAVAHLAGRLRLTVRSLVARGASRVAPRGPAPWEDRPDPESLPS
jgi:hypothetical protein